MARVCLFVLILNAFFANTLFGHEGMPEGVGLYEKPGQNIPLDLTFTDEKGSAVKLGQLIDKPTILTLVYYHCSHICPQMLLGLSEVLAKLDLVPGRDYRVITISLDETDSPEDARSQKENYIKAINKPFPYDSWKFLVGDKESIEKISGALGIKFEKETHGFVHPEVVIFISPNGGITRYLHVSKISYGVGYPVSFSPVAFSHALSNASKGVVEAGVRTAPLFCFPHEPGRQEKFFKTLAIFGVVTLLSLSALFGYLSLAHRKTPGRKE